MPPSSRIKQLIADTATCPIHQLHGILSLLRHFLNPNYIPVFGLPPTQEAIGRLQLVLHAARGLSVTISRNVHLESASVRDQFSNYFRAAWPAVWLWIQALETLLFSPQAWESEFIRCPPLRNDLWLTLAFLFHVPVRFRPLHDMVANTPGFKPLAMRLGYRHTTTGLPYGHAWASIFNFVFLPCTLDTVLLLRDTLGERKMGKAGIMQLRRFTLWLKEQTRLTPAAETRFTVLRLLSYELFGYRFLMLSSVRRATQILRALTSLPTPSDLDSRVADYIFYLLHYLLYSFARTDRLTWITQSLDAGLLPSLLKSIQWSHFFSAPYHTEILQTVLLPSSIFISVLRSARRALNKVHARSEADALQKSGDFWTAWSWFNTLVFERALVIGQQVMDAPDDCQNHPRCRCLGDENLKLRLCDGCSQVRYCSRRCQRKKWLEHREVCQALQRRRLEGATFESSNPDLHGALAIIRRGLRTNFKYFINTPGFIQSHKVILAMSMDYTTFPPQPLRKVLPASPTDAELDDYSRFLNIYMVLPSREKVQLRLPMDMKHGVDRMARLVNTLLDESEGQFRPLVSVAGEFDAPRGN
ncbi:hypothetical protein C8J57DRAFT_1596850 [Mycena rebaudengoi]|nr:hypothetical protein C8J57DRAFT_1596850 [Mycena rebaudengoi]